MPQERVRGRVATCRYYTQRRLNRASKKLGIPELIVYDQFEDRRVGLRFCTFVTAVQDLGNGCKVKSARGLLLSLCQSRHSEARPAG